LKSIDPAAPRGNADRTPDEHGGRSGHQWH
jgi:hypothetical protein